MRTIHNFFFSNTDPVGTVPARIVIGLCIFFYYLTEWNEFSLLYVEGGIQTFTLSRESVFVTPWIAYLNYFLVLMSSLCFTVGYRTRIAAFVLLAGFQYFRILAIQFSWGWTYIVSGILILLVLSGCQRNFSFDAKDYDKADRTQTPLWPIRLIQFYLCCIYIAAGVHRINDPAWMTGDMLLYALDVNMYSRFPFIDFLPLNQWLIPLTWAALIVELIAPIFLWIPKFRASTALILMVMHVLLELSATTGRWQLMLTGMLFVFLPPVMTRKFLKKLLAPVLRINTTLAFKERVARRFTQLENQS